MATSAAAISGPGSPTSSTAASTPQAKICASHAQGETGAADLSYVEAVVSEIARAISSYKVIVEKSTVPVSTNEWIRRVLYRLRHTVIYVFNPEGFGRCPGPGGVDIVNPKTRFS